MHKTDIVNELKFFINNYNVKNIINRQAWYCNLLADKVIDIINRYYISRKRYDGLYREKELLYKKYKKQLTENSCRKKILKDIVELKNNRGKKNV